MRSGAWAVGAALISLVGVYANCGGSEDTSGTGGSGASGTGSDCSGGANPGLGPFDAECADCHGVVGDPAPPPCTMGQFDTTYPAVGAHQSHADPSTWHRQIGCGECHLVPAFYGDPCVPTHEDGTADVVWGPVAKQGTYDPLTATCTNVWCHGGALQPDNEGGGAPTIRAPQWTVVDGTQAGCTLSCHTHPPGGTHDILTDCPTCHGEVISSFDEADPAASVFADPSKHIDGIHQAIGAGGGA